MMEIKLNIPKGCKTVTIKADGEKVTTEFEQKEEKLTLKDGDFIAFGRNPNDLAVGIFHRFSSLESHEDYATISGHIIEFNKRFWVNDNMRPATEEEKQRLLDALAKEGKRWNAEEKRVEDFHRWRAKPMGRYYFVSEILEVVICFDGLWEEDNKRHSCGNYFKTEEAAERVAKQIREIFKNSKAE